MSIVKSFSVGNGDMCYIRHGSANFTMIDCHLTGERDDEIIADMRAQCTGDVIRRFISTHPDQDHFGGIEKLDAALPVCNFYVVKNKAFKADKTTSFNYYCSLRDGNSAFNIFKGCKRAYLNEADSTRSSSGISILWPDVTNAHFTEALALCNQGANYNNVSAVIRYTVLNGASVMWLGDLDTEFMESIENSIELTKTTIVFAAHHGRQSGKIPNSWLEKLDPQIIIIGEAPSRHLNYYTGYKTITQNKAGDITMDLVGNKVHFYSSKDSYTNGGLDKEAGSKFPNYIGSITVETEYTLDG